MGGDYVVSRPTQSHSYSYPWRTQAKMLLVTLVVAPLAIAVVWAFPDGLPAILQSVVPRVVLTMWILIAFAAGCNAAWRAIRHQPFIALRKDGLRFAQFPRTVTIPWRAIVTVQVVRRGPEQSIRALPSQLDHLLLTVSGRRPLRVVDGLVGVSLDELAVQIDERRKLLA